MTARRVALACGEIMTRRGLAGQLRHHGALPIRRRGVRASLDHAKREDICRQQTHDGAHDEAAQDAHAKVTMQCHRT
jgi:hypothetical protein